MIDIIYLILTVLLGNYYNNHSFIGEKSNVIENIISVQSHADDIGWYW